LKACRRCWWTLFRKPKIGENEKKKRMEPFLLVTKSSPPSGGAQKKKRRKRRRRKGEEKEGKGRCKAIFKFGASQYAWEIAGRWQKKGFRVVAEVPNFNWVEPWALRAGYRQSSAYNKGQGLSKECSHKPISYLHPKL
jgi:hypothetical protein